MNNDDFLDDLKADWRSQPVELSLVRDRVEQRERELRASIGQIMLSIVMFLAGAAAFIWIAWREADALFALGALAFLVTIPFLLVELKLRRRNLRRDYLRPGRELLEHGLAQARTNRKILNLSRRVHSVLLAFAGATLVLAALDMVQLYRALLVAAAWGGVAIGSLWWQRTMAADASQEEAHYRSLLRDYPADEG